MSLKVCYCIRFAWESRCGDIYGGCHIVPADNPDDALFQFKQNWKRHEEEGRRLVGIRDITVFGGQSG